MTLSSTSGLGLGMGDYTGFVVSLPKSDLNSLPTQSTIVVKVSNTKYSKTYSTTISLASSITSPELVSISTPILVNKPQEFQLKYISLGEPSCALISYELNTQVYYIGKIGTDAQTCSSYFKNINTNFIIAYQTTTLNGDNIWKFNASLAKIGFVTLKINLTNALDAIVLRTSVNVLSSMLDCQNPDISIEKMSPYFYAPTVYKRNEMFSIKSTTIAKCNISIENSKQWSIFKLDETTGADKNSVSLTDNPTVEYGELVIQPNSLSYGLYRFNLKVSMLNTRNGLFQSELDTFVRVEPSGLVLSVLANAKIPAGGTYEISRGLEQAVEFNPYFFSYDVDGIVAVASLGFKYYCQVIELGVQMGFSKISNSEMVDLSMYKTRSDLVMRNNVTCFDSAGKFWFLFYRVLN